MSSLIQIISIIKIKNNIFSSIKKQEDVMEGSELLCFKLISAAGTARSCNIEAIQEAKKGNFEKAEALIEEGKKQLINAHDVHNELLQFNANGGNIGSSMLVMHSEDQLMSTETLQILAIEFIDTYRRLFELIEQKVN